MRKKAFHPTAEHFKVLRKLIKAERGTDRKPRLRTRKKGRKFTGRELIRGKIAVGLTEKYFNLPANKQREWLRKAKRRILYGVANQAQQAGSFLSMVRQMEDVTKTETDARKIWLEIHSKADTERKGFVRDQMMHTSLVETVYPEIEVQLLVPGISDENLDYYMDSLERINRPALLPMLRETLKKATHPKLRKRLLSLIEKLTALN